MFLVKFVVFYFRCYVFIHPYRAFIIAIYKFFRYIISKNIRYFTQNWNLGVMTLWLIFFPICEINSYIRWINFFLTPYILRFTLEIKWKVWWWQLRCKMHNALQNFPVGTRRYGWSIKAKSLVKTKATLEIIYSLIWWNPIHEINEKSFIPSVT